MRGIRLRMGRWDRRMHMQGMRIHELTVETVAGISGHALSGQKTCRGGRLCPPRRKRCG